MARVTVEDCLARIPNRFALTIAGSRRARALSEDRGHALVECENKDAVTALREISASKVRFREDVESTLTEFIEEQRRQLRVTTGEHTFLEAASLRALEDDDDGDDVEAPDVEELQSDPEALNKQAKGADDSTDDDSDDADGDGDSDDSSTTEDAPADDVVEGEAFGDDDLPEDDGDGNDSGDSSDDGDAAKASD